MTNDARSHLAIALDVSDLTTAKDLVAEVAPHIGVAKIGLQLFSVAGPQAVEEIRSLGMNVLLDLKLHDIPNTVGAAAKELGKLGVRYVTSHTQGGVPMLQAAVDGLEEGASTAGVEAPMVLAVTVLTSDAEATPEILAERVDIAAKARCGVVCAVPDLPIVKNAAPEIFTLTPGIRLPGGDAHDQKRIATPTLAIESGSNLLVIGRAVTAATEPAETAAAINAEVADVLS